MASSFVHVPAKPRSETKNKKENACLPKLCEMKDFSSSASVAASRQNGIFFSKLSDSDDDCLAMYIGSGRR